MALLYLSSFFPKRSETFVYREVLGLRARGVDIVTASLHEPEGSQGDPSLEALVRETTTLYPAGLSRLLRDAFSFALRHPAAAFVTLGMAAGDAFTAADLRLAHRAKVPVQALASLALAWRLRHRRLTGVHSHMAHAPATVGMYLAHALGLPMSFTGHAADLFRDRCLLPQKLRRASFVACISAWHRAWYQTMIPGDESKYPVIRCGVDVPEKSVSLRETGILRIFGMARLVPKKGFDTLLKALAKAHRKQTPFFCTLAGDGPEADRLQHLAIDLKIADRVRFLGEVPHSSVPNLLHDSDVMILPCKVDAQGDRDGIPVALMEAMASGVPVVSGDLPTIRELITHRVHGLLVPPGDEEALADAIGELASQPTLRRSLGQSGKDRIKEEFSSERNLVSLMDSFSAHNML